ncbi:hypothetical protein [Paenibacillus glucanolyticus]|uniref:hypothetical protein n=1 Tax=Paenibacillus glucanolyticus TaxID=59843 RepID=UPI0030CC3B7F
MSLIIDTYNQKNERVATAWELLRKYYRPQLSQLAFLFADYCYEVASEIVNNKTDFDGDHIRFNCLRQDVYDYLQIKESTFRTKNKTTRLCPREELEQIGFIFKQGNSIQHIKGDIFIPMFSQIEIDTNKIIFDTFTEHKFGKEKTVQRLVLLAEKARGLGKLLKPHELDFAVANISNYKLNETDPDELKEQKLRKQYFILLYTKGFDPKQNKDMHYASINQIFNRVITNQFHFALQAGIQYVLKDKKLTGYEEINGALRSRTDKIINKMLAPKMSFEDKREMEINRIRLELRDKLASFKTVKEKLKFLYEEKDRAYVKWLERCDYEYYSYVVGWIQMIDKNYGCKIIKENNEDDLFVKEFETEYMEYYNDCSEEIMFG